MATEQLSHLFVLGHVEVPVSVTGRGSITKRDRIPVYGDDPRFYPPLVALALNPESIEWLILELESAVRGFSEDGFITDLKRLRDEVRETLWERTVA